MTIRLTAEECGRPWTTPAAKHFKHWRNLRLTKKLHDVAYVHTAQQATLHQPLYRRRYAGNLQGLRNNSMP